MSKIVPRVFFTCCAVNIVNKTRTAHVDPTTDYLQILEKNAKIGI
jgi:hypothetical protein